MIYGYARVSSIGQDYSIQEAALVKAGCSIVRSEKVTGTKLKGREERTRFSSSCGQVIR
jgi:DNA invertase Pin-like site-specific DNA recombinase